MAIASIRARLTAWYGTVLLMMMLGLGSAVYVLMARAMLDRVDSMLDFELSEAAERLSSGEKSGGPDLPPAAFHETYSLTIWDAQGQPLEENPGPVGRAIGRMADQIRPGHATVRLEPQGRYRIAERAVGTGEARRTIQIATSLASYDHELAVLRGVLCTILPAGLLAATLGGYVLAGRALAPVGRMADSARRISAANLCERVRPAHQRDELGRLGETLNAMLDRIDRAFAATRRFTGDAAHELRTPLTALRAEAEVALLAPRSPQEYERTLRSIVDEVDRLSRLTEQLLLLSREDQGVHQNLPGQAIRLDALVRQSVRLAEDSARHAGLALHLEPLPVLKVVAHPELIRQALGNLLENAIKFTPAGGIVAVRGHVEQATATDPDRALIEVRDTGLGISLDVLPHIFDRFYRVDTSRSRKTGGNGLGLSIARALIERHGGTIQATSTPGAGSTFRIALPLSHAQADPPRPSLSPAPEMA